MSRLSKLRDLKFKVLCIVNLLLGVLCLEVLVEYWYDMTIDLIEAGLVLKRPRSPHWIVLELVVGLNGERT